MLKNRRIVESQVRRDLEDHLAQHFLAKAQYPVQPSLQSVQCWGKKRLSLGEKVAFKAPKARGHPAAFTFLTGLVAPVFSFPGRTFSPGSWQGPSSFKPSPGSVTAAPTGRGGRKILLNQREY